jgi:gamma-glutamylcysteine synthetase
MELRRNQANVASYGRDSTLDLTYEGVHVPMKEEARRFLEAMLPLCEALDAEADVAQPSTPKQEQQQQSTGLYVKSLKAQMAKIENPLVTPSAQVLFNINDKSHGSFHDYGMRLATKQQDQYLTGEPLNDAAYWAQVAQQSLADQVAEEVLDEKNDVSFNQYVSDYYKSYDAELKFV